MSHYAVEFDELIHQAVKVKATDIHIFIDKRHSSVILRRHKVKIDEYDSVSPRMLIEYIKYVSGTEVNIGGEPFSVQFSYIVEENDYYLRYAQIETPFQTHAVIRILNHGVINSLDDCKIPVNISERIRSFYRQSYGLMLFTGKTGSGKSTTMFSSLNELKDVQIITLENPVERYYGSMVQIYTPTDRIETYVTQILRHDPDILVLGEIRTEFELLQCLRCVLSGHLVVATMHSGSFESLISRIDELNKSTIDINELLFGIVYQELRYYEGSVKVNLEFWDTNSQKNI